MQNSYCAASVRIGAHRVQRTHRADLLSAFAVVIMCSWLSTAGAADIDWQASPVPAENYLYPGERLGHVWHHLHRTDGEPFPSPAYLRDWIEREPVVRDSLTDFDGDARTLAQQLQQAWRHYHAGEFAEAWRLGSTLGLPGAYVASRALAVHSQHLADDAARKAELEHNLATLQALDEHELLVTANLEMALIYVAGRLAQELGLMQALRRGSPRELRRRLEAVLADNPAHVEAHLGMGAFHAELVYRAGRPAAALMYGARADRARDYYSRALELAPESVLVHVEYAHALQLLGADTRQRRELLSAAVELTPHDAATHLEQQRAERMLREIEGNGP